MLSPLWMLSGGSEAWLPVSHKGVTTDTHGALDS